MEKFKNLDRRAQVLIIFFALILIYGAIFYMSLPESSSPVKEKTPSFPSPGFSNKTNPSLTPPPNAWKRYKTAEYEITVPSDWKGERFSLVQGREVVRIKPNYLSDKEFYPSITIAVNSASESAKLERGYFAMGFKKSTILINNFPATKYSITFDTKVVGNQPFPGVNQEVFVLLLRRSWVYSFSYQYEGSQADKGYEDFFNGVISSVKFP